MSQGQWGALTPPLLLFQGGTPLPAHPVLPLAWKGDNCSPKLLVSSGLGAPLPLPHAGKKLCTPSPPCTSSPPVEGEGSGPSGEGGVWSPAPLLSSGWALLFPALLPPWHQAAAFASTPWPAWTLHVSWDAPQSWSLERATLHREFSPSVEEHALDWMWGMVSCWDHGLDAAGACSFEAARGTCLAMASSQCRQRHQLTGSQQQPVSLECRHSDAFCHTITFRTHGALS